MNAQHPTHTQRRKRKDFPRQVKELIRDLPRFHTRESYEATVEHIAVETVEMKIRNSEKLKQWRVRNLDDIVRWSE